MKLFILSLAPIVSILIYIYIKDKYEKEPKMLALKGTLYGFLSSIFIILTQNVLFKFQDYFNTNYFFYIFFKSFIIAAFVEETYKYLILHFLIKKNKNYNEPFDGLVYAIFISLGFASIENMLYCLDINIGGLRTAVLRAIFSVPAHALFGFFMGYYMSINKFKIKNKNAFLSYILPLFLHGLFNILLFNTIPYNAIFFLIFYFYMIINASFKLKYYLKISPFNPKNKFYKK